MGSCKKRIFYGQADHKGGRKVCVYVGGGGVKLSTLMASPTVKYPFFMTSLCELCVDLDKHLLFYFTFSLSCCSLYVWVPEAHVELALV